MTTEPRTQAESEQTKRLDEWFSTRISKTACRIELLELSRRLDEQREQIRAKAGVLANFSQRIRVLEEKSKPAGYHDVDEFYKDEPQPAAQATAVEGIRSPSSPPVREAGTNNDACSRCGAWKKYARLEKDRSGCYSACGADATFWCAQRAVNTPAPLSDRERCAKIAERMFYILEDKKIGVNGGDDRASLWFALAPDTKTEKWLGWLREIITDALLAAEERGATRAEPQAGTDPPYTVEAALFPPQAWYVKGPWPNCGGVSIVQHTRKAADELANNMNAAYRCGRKGQP